MPELNDYGFLTEFHLEPAEARERIKKLAQEFGIKHFQFYDVAYRGEEIIPEADEWPDAYTSLYNGNRRIKKATLDAYIDEIQKQNSISWIYTGITASGNYKSLPWAAGLFRKQEKGYIQDWHVDTNGKGVCALFDPENKTVQEHFFKSYAKALALGFTGLHIDHFGPRGQAYRFTGQGNPEPGREEFQEFDECKAYANFLSALKSRFPGTNVNFNATCTHGLSETENLVAFPYLEFWEDDIELEKLCKSLGSRHKKFVIARYTPLKEGKFDWELFNKRKMIINGAGGTFLYRGDDNKFLTGCYFPNAETIR